MKEQNPGLADRLQSLGSVFPFSPFCLHGRSAPVSLARAMMMTQTGTPWFVDPRVGCRKVIFDGKVGSETLVIFSAGGHSACCYLCVYNKAVLHNTRTFATRRKCIIRLNSPRFSGQHDGHRFCPFHWHCSVFLKTGQLHPRVAESRPEAADANLIFPKTTVPTW